MKLMNEIEAEVSGVLAKTFVNNGSPVEYGMKRVALECGGKSPQVFMALVLPRSRWIGRTSSRRETVFLRSANRR